MSIVYSPSNMMTYRQCPLRFYGRHISKEMPYRDSPQMQRGNAVHEKVETAVQKGVQAVSWDDPKLDKDYIFRQVANVWSCKSAGCEVLVEKEMIINRDKQPLTDWWDKNAWLRARADIVVLPPSHVPHMTLIDIKTGKKWDEEDFQLRAEAYLAYFLWGKRRINYVYWYVDSGESVKGFVDMSSNSMERFLPVKATLDDMDVALKNNSFEPKRNNHCKFCDFYKKPEKCRVWM